MGNGEVMGQAALKLVDYERANISQLAEDFDLDRASVRKRIQEAGIEPIEEKAKEKIYELTPRLAAILSNIDSPLSEAKLRRETAEAEMRELKLAEMKGDLIPMIEVVDIAQRIASTLYQEYAIRQPKRIGTKLAKAKNVAAVKSILKSDSDKIMKSLRTNFARFIET